MKPSIKVRLSDVARLATAGRFAQAFEMLRGLPAAAPAPQRTAPQTPMPSFVAPARWPPVDRSPSNFEERNFVGAGGSRTYKLYVPGAARPAPASETFPLIVMLHGCTQSPDDFAAGTRMNERAEEAGFFVAWPAQPATANVSKCWNWFNVADQARDRGEPSLIAGITREVMRDFPIDPARVYVAGLSAGGAAAAIMGARYPDLYAAIGVHSGLACGAARDLNTALAAMKSGGRADIEPAARAMPTIIFHGDADKVVNPRNADQVAAQSTSSATLKRSVEQGRSAGGVDYTRAIEADRDGHPVLERWTLHGAGHAWSGGSAAGSFTDPRGPDASRAMVRFFQEHALQPA
jgi:poly(hydroxyalkanoate) depolymerase family esterase